MKLQYINDTNGKPQFVVLPIEEFKRLTALDDDLIFQDVPYQSDHTDNETVPNEVINIMFDQDLSLLAAWRVYRGLSQYDVAVKTGLTQSSISQAEKKGSKPQQKTCERLAAIYNCKPEQLFL
ncbi:helix-turn-helix domain-containing protein [Pasteurella multocida]|uniref:helix-turn-helix domain-containing protein n=1 Tax=Pasteurella multocida TaxID=747 RepID=UPI00111A2844|nr:helix-turn-helix transcriptional regulator [Pasteurella multocida]MDY0489447.1 helix-turn-helix transcriptional regulator [Pasteurella multocida]MDY0595977.1 helix-turn-helix transcriptional regulator [Pasteurella multocida]MDY0633201.1 helix-turn-helix transcriptional regulator [Pasteurella multocida]MDY0665400.1 helix-turn-helix transcriptional regulator [Pasteurella multocida]MDY0667502.1 helix-turn-helix transcriptional regulator [Pasteurella multocida]